MNRNYLIDTNVWLECLIGAGRADEARLFFATVPAEQIYISDLTLHTIGRYCSETGNMNVFVAWVNDLFVKNNVNRISLDYVDYGELSEMVSGVEFDYDDAWHYLTAKTHDLVWLSFNADLGFDDVEIRTPAQALLDLKVTGKA